MNQPRLRRDPRDRASLRQGPPRAPRPEGPPPRVLAPGTSLVAALLGVEGGALAPSDREALALGAAAARRQGQGLLAICPGIEAPEGLADAGADRVALLPAGSPEAISHLLAGIWAPLSISQAVAIEGTAPAETLRRLAALSGRDLRANVARLTEEGCICLEDSGALERPRTRAPLLIGTAGRCHPNPGVSPGEASTLDLPEVPVAAPALADLGLERADARTVPLAEAGIVLSAGAGLSDWPLFHRLAAALGAAVAGSRVVCDAGHLPRDRQVGVSGTLVAARCYIALGISGAIQHLQGIEACRTVIAVNRDPHAPIHRRADLSVIADTAEVMQALLSRLEAR